MGRTIADQFAETLATAGVKRIYGIVGDSLNGLTDAVRDFGACEAWFAAYLAANSGGSAAGTLGRNGASGETKRPGTARRTKSAPRQSDT